MSLVCSSQVYLEEKEGVISYNPQLTTPAALEKFVNAIGKFRATLKNSSSDTAGEIEKVFFESSCSKVMGILSW